MPSVITIAPVITRQSQKKDGTFPVRIRITFKRRYKLLSTNIVADKTQLSRSLEIVDPALSEIVSTLVRRMREAASRIDPFALDGMEVEQVTASIEKSLRMADGPFELDFPDYFEKIASEKTKNAKTNYMCALHSLCSYLGSDHFDISVISSSMMHRFERHLREKYGNAARAVSLYTSSIAYVHRRAREEYNNEETGEIYVKNPFDFYKCPKQQQAKHKDVDPKVIEKMIKWRGTLSGRERIGVDLFLISFALMGMNTPDIYSCARPKNGVIIYNRTKTKEHRDDKAEMHVRIEDCVKPLLSEYYDLGRQRAFTFYHRYCNYKNLGRAANVGLHSFLKRIKAPKLNVYDGRHAWATIARHYAKIEKATVDEALCHVGEHRMADVYIQKDWEILWEANRKVLALFSWPD